MFAGSQIQPAQRTVQGELQRALAAVVGAPVTATFAGRTDRGVHATGQVAAVDLPMWRGPAAALMRGLRAHLPGDLSAIAVDACPGSFHPRFDARWREYRYWICPGGANPFLGRFAWIPRARLDFRPMVAGAAHFVGTHDFASFASGGEGVPWSERHQRPRGTVRTVYRCECRDVELVRSPGIVDARRLVELRVVADGFLPRMVRNMVGALTEVGRGAREPEWIAEILDAGDRRRGSTAAPAHGLTLWRVGFGEDTPEAW